MAKRMTDERLEAYIEEKKVPPSGARVVREVWRAKGARRKIRSSRFHGSARIASRKAGKTRDAESITGEYWVYKLFEFLASVLWYIAQPTERVRRDWVCLRPDGREYTVPVWATLDAFVLWADRAPGWVDIKTLAAIKKTNRDHPGFYELREDGWHCPTGDAYAERLGLSYLVIVVDELNPVEVANADYLRSFMDRDITQETVDRLRAFVAEHPLVTVAALRRAAFAPDDIFTAVWRGDLWIDLSKHHLREQEVAFVYLDPVAASAMPEPLVVAVGGRRPKPVHVAKGEEVLWRDAHYRINYAKGGTVHLVPIAEGGTDVVMASSRLEAEARAGRMCGLGPTDPGERSNLALLERRFAGASPEAIERGEERLAALRAYWAGARDRDDFPLVGGELPALATVREWQTKFFVWADLGCGFAGLLDQPRPGRPGSHLESSTSDELVAVAASYFLDGGRKLSVAALHKVFTAHLNRLEGNEGRVIPRCSYSAVLTWVRGQPRYATMVKRLGRKGAAAQRPWATLDPESPSPNGQYPGHVGHGDATPADMMCVERWTREGWIRHGVFRLVDGVAGKKLGRAWYTGEVDEGVVLEALADQIRTHGFLCPVYVLDNALAHKTVRVQQFLAKHGSDVVYRATSDGRGGLPVEREFGALNTDALHALRANTQILRDPRAMEPELDPRKTAIWTLTELAAVVDARDEAVERTRSIQALRMTTSEAWAARDEHGFRSAHRVRWTDAVERELGIVHKYRPHVDNTDGIWVNRLYYWHPSMEHATLQGLPVRVVTLRRDIGRVWVFLPQHTLDGAQVSGEWVEASLRSPIAREHVTYEELHAFTKVILNYEEGHYARKQIENGALGEVLLAAFEREQALLEEQRKIRERSGRRTSKPANLTRGDVLTDAPVPPSSGLPVTAPVPAPDRRAGKVIKFGSRSRGAIARRSAAAGEASS